MTLLNCKCILSSEMIAKYRDKVKTLEPQIDSVIKEEEAEKTIARAEIEANKAIKMLEMKKVKKKNKKQAAAEKRDPNQRIWFQSHKERIDGKEFEIWLDEFIKELLLVYCILFVVLNFLIDRKR